ncbi:MAG: mycofactocin system transcriptional regulator [Gordonia sp. (in: high G+C Gram-positive bacteria)]|uniref:mycofactocin system transcriptional regulator n=1 Tax=Gordonia sp. (in: high G+C Gram-positive bacteria) TaxID=84139 RepID=UPI003BB5183D
MTRSGRPQATTKADLADLAIVLFTERGFESTSVDDVAEAASISRRTLFRYYPSKNALAWGDFAAHLAEMRQELAATPPNVPLGESLRRVLISFNRVAESEHEAHRRRMRLLLKVPALQGHSMLMYDEWRQIVAAHIAGRLGSSPNDHVPQSFAWQFLGASMAAYDQWLDDADSDLAALLDEGYSLVIDGLIPYVEHVLVSQRAGL